MVSYCQVEGINTFFVVEVSAAAINSYETDMLYNNFVEGIIQPEFRAINGDMFIYCKINGMKSLDDISDRGDNVHGAGCCSHEIVVQCGHGDGRIHA